jgi:hypothetical protein
MLKIKIKSIIVVPDKFLSNFVTDFYKHLISIFSNALDEEVSIIKSSRLCDSDLRNINTAIIISIAHWPIEHLKYIMRLKESSTLICWHDDLFWVNEEHRRMNEEIFKKSHMIIHGSKYSFLDMWSKYENKSYWLPLFAPDYFHQEFNSNPKIKCLLSGSSQKTHYPIRHKIKSSNSQHIDVVEHVGYNNIDNNKYAREKYAKLINSYFCCVFDSGIVYGSCKYTISSKERKFNKPIDFYLKEKMGTEKLKRFKSKGLVLLKLFEIPASGSLMIVDGHVKEMYELGYKPNENFVEMNENNVLDVIEDCCLNHNKYEEIRYNGWLLSKKHRMKQRQHKLRKILKNVKI